MKKVTFVLLLSIFSFLNCQAITKQENIKLLFQLMQTDSVIQKMSESMMPMLMSTLPQVPDSAAREQMTEQINVQMKKVTNIMMDITNRLLNEDMVEVYDKYFTEKEIKGLVAFYKSPAGMKMVQVTPEMNKEMISILLTKYLPEMQRKLKDSK